jgi:hypothetical protein
MTKQPSWRPPDSTSTLGSSIQIAPVDHINHDNATMKLLALIPLAYTAHAFTDTSPFIFLSTAASVSPPTLQRRSR